MKAGFDGAVAVVMLNLDNGFAMDCAFKLNHTLWHGADWTGSIIEFSTEFE